MTLRTVTYDDTKFKIVPLEPVPEQLAATNDLLDVSDEYGYLFFKRDFGESDLYKAMIKAAPEYQEPTKDE